MLSTHPIPVIHPSSNGVSLPPVDAPSADEVSNINMMASPAGSTRSTPRGPRGNGNGNGKQVATMSDAEFGNIIKKRLVSSEEVTVPSSSLPHLQERGNRGPSPGEDAGPITTEEVAYIRGFYRRTFPSLVEGKETECWKPIDEWQDHQVRERSDWTYCALLALLRLKLPPRVTFAFKLTISLNSTSERMKRGRIIIARRFAPRGGSASGLTARRCRFYV